MRILIVTNLYPPYYRGGYELRCAQVAEELRRTGHDVRVLTTVDGLPLTRWGSIQPRTDSHHDVPVYRWLNQYVFEPQPPHRPWTLFCAKRELSDARTFARLLATFRPDVVNWWSLYGVAKMLLPICEQRGTPDVHWVEHWWMIDEFDVPGGRTAAFWNSFWDGRWGPRWSRPLLQIVGRMWERRVRREGLPTREFPLRPRHVCFVSEFMRTLHRDAGLEFRSSEVIHGGVPTNRFLAARGDERGPSETLRVLYAGQISPDRGLGTVVEALANVDGATRARIRLSVAGTGPHGFVEHIKERVEALGLSDHVSFLGKVSHEEMAKVYREHDVLVFPSTRAEGLPLTMVEAMLAGCAVLTTGSGGAQEIAALADLPLFPGDDPEALALLLARLTRNRDEVRAISARGQEVARNEFSLDRMMARLLATLEALGGGQEGAAPATPGGRGEVETEPSRTSATGSGNTQP